MEEGILNDLILFIYEQSRTDVLITLDSKIEDDLGVTGEDGEALITAFSKRYHVNIDNFYFNQYFYPEPFVFPMPEKIELLTVGHLLKAIGAGRLDEDIINSK